MNIEYRTRNTEFRSEFPHSSLLTPHSSLLTPHSSLLTPHSSLPYTIRLARPEDEAAIVAVEVAASALFLTIGFPPLEGAPVHLPPATIQAGISEECLWVAVDAEGLIIGFALAGWVDAQAHLFEIDVLPDYGRQGIGRALIEQVKQWGRLHGSECVTLTTFCEVPWNGPFYRRLGFEEVESTQMGPALSTILQKEKAENTLDWDRCAMRLTL